ncbi:WG repeat-containing protein [Leptospira sp. WS92.C1]
MTHFLRRVAFLILISISQLDCKKPSLVSFEENGFYGFKDTKGKIIITPQYEVVNDFNEKGVAFAFGKEGWICIDSDNKNLLNSFAFDNGPDIPSDGMSRYAENGKIGFHDSACKKIIEAKYDFAYPFENGFSIVCNGCTSIKTGEHSEIQGGNYGVIDQKGKTIVEIEYDSILSIDPGEKIIEVIKAGIKKQINIP